MIIQNHVKFNNYPIYMNMKKFQIFKFNFDHSFVTYSGPQDWLQVLN